MPALGVATLVRVVKIFWRVSEKFRKENIANICGKILNSSFSKVASYNAMMQLSNLHQIKMYFKGDENVSSSLERFSPLPSPFQLRENKVNLSCLLYIICMVESCYYSSSIIFYCIYLHDNRVITRRVSLPACTQFLLFHTV